MKSVAVAATFAVLVVGGQASSGVAAEDDLPDAVAIPDRSLLALDDRRAPPAACQQFTCESGVQAILFDGFEPALTARSLPTTPLLETNQALARVAAEAGSSDEATIAEQQLLGCAEEEMHLAVYPS